MSSIMQPQTRESSALILLCEILIDAHHLRMGQPEGAGIHADVYAQAEMLSHRLAILGMLGPKVRLLLGKLSCLQDERCPEEILDHLESLMEDARVLAITP